MDYKELAADLLSGCEENCADCEYAGDSEFECTIAKLAATAITDLLERSEEAEARAEKAERERDAAISDLTYIARTYPVDLCDDLVCQYCKHYQNVNTGCPGWTENDCFEWRGNKEE